MFALLLPCFSNASVDDDAELAYQLDEITPTVERIYPTRNAVLKKRVTELENQVNEFKDKVNKLEDKVKSLRQLMSVLYPIFYDNFEGDFSENTLDSIEDCLNFKEP